MEDIKEEHDIFYEVCEKEEPKFSLYDSQENLAGNNNCTSEFGGFKSEDVKHEPPEDCKYFVDSKDLSSISKLETVNVKPINVKKEKCIEIDELLNHSLNSTACMFVCEYCDFSTKFQGNLKRHIHRKHQSVKDSSTHKKAYRKRNKKCIHCSFKSVSSAEMKMHIINKHKGVFAFNCYFCNYGINKKISLLDHIFKKHEAGSVDGPFGCFETCTHCHFATDFKDELLDHILNSHRKDKSVEYCCKLCSRAFKSKYDLIKHIDGFHKKIRPYACLLCDYSASMMSDLKIHISAKHNKITPFRCEHCNYASAYKKHLRRHILTRHFKNSKKTMKKS